MKRCGIEDIKLVRDVMTDPDVYPGMIDDGSPPPDCLPVWDMLKDRLSYYIMPNAGSLFIYTPFCFCTYMWHTCIKKDFRGKQAFNACREATQWMFDNTNAIKIISVVPENNRAALLFGLKCGFKKEGRMLKSWVKDGRTTDLILVGKEI